MPLHLADGLQVYDSLLCRLQNVADCPSNSRELRKVLEPWAVVHGCGAEIAAPDDAASRTCVINSGWAYRSCILPDGRRQIFSIFLPGEVIHVSKSGSPLSRCPVTALTRLTTVALRPAVGSGEREDSPEVAPALEMLAQMEEVSMVDHLVRLGCQTAFERLCHMVLELHDRLSVIHFVHHGAFLMPMSQELIGDMLGLSLVHVNRTIKEMKRQELITTNGRMFTVLDRERLAYAAGCVPATSKWQRPPPANAVQVSDAMLYS